MASNALSSSEKDSYILVSFSTNDGTLIEAYTDWGSDVSFEGLVYSSETSLEVTLPKNTGTLQRTFCTIRMESSASPVLVGELSRTTKHAEVEVDIVEVVRPTSPGPAQNILRPVTGALVERLKLNAGGLEGVARFQCSTVKSRIRDVKLGLSCNHECSNRLGDGICGINLAVASRTLLAPLRTISGPEITVEDSAIPVGLRDRLFHSGYLVRNGLHLEIEEWRNESNGAKNQFFLKRQPPVEWLNEVVTIVAGCDKSVDECKLYVPDLGPVPGTTGNEARFRGPGIGMQPYNPNFENRRGPAS